LSGKAQATSQTSLSTTLTGRVAAVLPSGTLVVEAERQITMNNQHEPSSFAAWCGPAISMPPTLSRRTTWVTLKSKSKAKELSAKGRVRRIRL